VPVRSLSAAAAWVDRVGLALVFPKDDLVLPSLWEAAGGADEYAERDEGGTFLRWTKPMEFVWRTKDELPERGLACAGKHLRGRASIVSLELLPALVATAPRSKLSSVEQDVLAVVDEHGPTSTRVLPELLPQHERKRVRAAADRLQRQLLLTNAGLEETDGWPAIVLDLVGRRYAERLRALPGLDDARNRLASRVLDTAGELSAVDLAAALGWRKRDAAGALESLGAHTRDENGITLWKRRR